MNDNNNVDLLLDQFPMITLNSGVTICNFSSFHDYWLRTDEHDTKGETLPCCTKEVADRHKLIAEESLVSRWKEFDTLRDDIDHDDSPDWMDVNLDLRIDLHTKKDLYVLAKMQKLDIILVPYPIQAILNKKWKKDTRSYIIWCKSRTCRKIDSRDNTQGIYSNKFCV
jgi:hypothetical protein